MDAYADLKIRVKNLEKINNINIHETGIDNSNMMDKFKVSKIIKEDEVNLIKNWMLNKEDFNTLLLYRATRDGDTLEKIQEKCEGKGPTIHLFKLTNGFSVYVQKDLIKKKQKNDHAIFAFSLNNKKKYYPHNKEDTHISDLFNSYIFNVVSGGNSIIVYNRCLSSDKVWINYKMLHDCNPQEFCGLYKDEYTSLLDYEVFQIKY